MSGRCLECVWRVSGMCLEGVCNVSGKCFMLYSGPVSQPTIWTVSLQCLGGDWKVSGCEPGVYMGLLFTVCCWDHSQVSHVRPETGAPM